MSVRDLHVAWAWVAVLGNAVAGAWCLGAHRYPGLRRSGLWWATAFVQIAVFVEVILGVIALNVADLEPDQLQFHMFYGFVALLSIAILYAYRAQLRDRLYLLYGLGGLWVMGLGIRAMTLHR